MISPIGSASAAICRNPSAMAEIPCASSMRRSIIAASRSRRPASARSRAFASRRRVASLSIAAAISASARFFVAVSAVAITRDAARARRPTPWM
jgi:hypothetical protein